MQCMMYDAGSAMRTEHHFVLFVTITNVATTFILVDATSDHACTERTVR